MKNLSANEKVGVFVALVVVIFFFIVGPAIIEPIVGISNQSEFNERSDGVDTSIDIMEVNIVDTKIGDGKEARNGDRVIVHYIGKLEDGVVFDSSIERGNTFTFTLGIGQVIEGWERGILGMKVGGERTLTIPPELGYGEQGVGPIPGGATLIFDVILVDIEG